MNPAAGFRTKLPLATSTFDCFLGLPPPLKCQATYVWVDETGENLRSKTRTLDFVPPTLKDYPLWNFAHWDRVKDSDMSLRPLAVYRDPFLGPNARLVLCSTYSFEGEPTETNFRHECEKAVKKSEGQSLLVEWKQDFLLLDRDGWPLGWPKHGFPAPAGRSFCSVGADRLFGRELVDLFFRACLHAELPIDGVQAEKTPGQWSFQLAPSAGISAADDLWTARFLLQRTAEQFGVLVSFEPKPPMLVGQAKEQSCSCTISTKSTHRSKEAAANCDPYRLLSAFFQSTSHLS